MQIFLVIGLWGYEVMRLNDNDRVAIDKIDKIFVVSR